MFVVNWTYILKYDSKRASDNVAKTQHAYMQQWHNDVQ